MLTFITGESGCGRTQYIYNMAVKADGDRLLFVPDQFLFETEKMIAEMAGEKTDGLSICGFSSLSEKILKEYMPRKTYADNAAKLIIMQGVLKQLREKSLKFYAKAAFKSSFAAVCLDMVSMFKSSGISCDTVQDIAEKTDGSFKEKLGDISAIYALYDSTLRKIYDDRQDNLILAADAINEQDCFAGYSIFIDGFDSFSGSQLKFLEPIIRQCDRSYVGLCMSENDYSCFKAQENTMAQLSSFAEKENAEINSIVLNCAPRYKSEDLLHLRNEIPKDLPQKYEGKAENITLPFAGNATDECEYVCATIKKLVANGMRYNEITVLCANPPYYADTMQSAALRYEIPLFADIPVAISEKPLLKYIGFLLTAADNPTGENVMRYIKSGFVRIKAENGKTRPITLKQIYDLENYCYLWDIEHRSFAKPFSRLKTDSDKELEILRDAIVTPLVRLKSSLKGCDGKEITKRLTEFLFDEADIKAAIQGKCQDYTTSDLVYDKALTEEYNQLWDYTSQLLTSCYNTMEGMPLTISEYASAFAICAMQTSLSKPPQVLDSVLFGDTGRTRSAGARAVFIMGADVNSFPAEGYENTGVFTEKEYAALCEKGMDLRQSNEEKYALALLESYKALTLAGEKLYISWRGNKENLCDSVNTITEIFPQLEITDIACIPDEYFCESVASARRQLARGFAGNSTASPIYQALKNVGDTDYLTLRERAIDKRSDNSDKHEINDVAPLVFANTVLSPTAIDKLSSCRFDYFCKYGLGLYDKSTIRMNSLNFGNIVHAVMEYCFKRLYTGGENKAYSEDELTELIKAALDSYREENLMDAEDHSARFNLIYSSIEGLCLNLLKHMTAELAKSSFRPLYFELKLSDRNENITDISAKPFTISVTGRDKKQQTVMLTGTVDRVDVAETVRGKELRVIDYKTGDMDFDLHKVYYGHNLQLLLYLFTLCDNNPDYLPSAATYFPNATDTPLKKVPNPSDELMRGFWLSKHSETGIAVTDTQADKESENYNTRVLDSKGIEQDGNVFAATKVTAEKLEKLKERVTKVISDNMGKVLCGDISANPLVMGKKEFACAYCEYRQICGRRSDSDIEINDDASTEFINDITATEQPEEAVQATDSKESV